MAKKRRDDTSLSSLLGRKREINIDEIEKATQKVHDPKKETGAVPGEKTEAGKKTPVRSSKPKTKSKASPRTEKKKPIPNESEQVVRASIATPYDLYLRSKRLQRQEGFRSLGAFFLHCVEDYLQKPVGKPSNYSDPDFSDSIDVSVSPELELWTQIKLNQRKMGFKNMAGFYVFCLNRYLQKNK